MFICRSIGLVFIGKKNSTIAGEILQTWIVALWVTTVYLGCVKKRMVFFLRPRKVARKRWPRSQIWYLTGAPHLFFFLFAFFHFLNRVSNVAQITCSMKTRTAVIRTVDLVVPLPHAKFIPNIFHQTDATISLIAQYSASVTSLAFSSVFHSAFFLILTIGYLCHDFCQPIAIFINHFHCHCHEKGV